jgi:hypothetical protein
MNNKSDKFANVMYILNTVIILNIGIPFLLHK